MALVGVTYLKNLLPHLVCHAEVDIDEAVNARIMDLIENLKAEHRGGCVVSNESGGWQHELPLRGELQPILGEARELSAALLREYSVAFSEISFTAAWANINYYKDHNITHRHGGNLSGVYYLNAARGSGDLVLGSVAAYSLENRILKQARDSRGNSFLGHSVEPRIKRMVVFSSETNHHVKANLSGEARVSVAWNATVSL